MDFLIFSLVSVFLIITERVSEGNFQKIRTDVIRKNTFKKVHRTISVHFILAKIFCHLVLVNYNSSLHVPHEHHVCS